MSLEFRHIAHTYGDVPALRDVSFTALRGEITCLLGSSGCGKSTLLSLAAGLLDLQHGSIVADGEVLAEPGRSPPPERRGIGLVLQDGALFPHMTIAGNVAFGLPRASKAQITDQLARVDLAGLGERYPHELSGGQRQRAALARAITPEPRVLLMDEPFASVDIVLRRRLRRDCRMLLRDRGTTTLLVTHDPEEAMDVGDAIAVMDAGRIVQCGTPQKLFEYPQSAAIGAMFGSGQIVGAQRIEGGLRTPFGVWPLSCIIGQMPEVAAMDLLVPAESVGLELDEAGSPVRDHRRIAQADRVVLCAKDNTRLEIVASGPVDLHALYRPVPRSRSVRAFAAS